MEVARSAVVIAVVRASKSDSEALHCSQLGMSTFLSCSDCGCLNPALATTTLTLKGAGLSADTRPAVTDPAQSWWIFACRENRTECRGTRAGWRATPSSPVRLFPTALIETSSLLFVQRSSKRELATRTQDCACRLAPEKERCNDVGRNADTRDGLAGLWLCTDANEPQCTSVIKSEKVDALFFKKI